LRLHGGPITDETAGHVAALACRHTATLRLLTLRQLLLPLLRRRRTLRRPLLLLLLRRWLCRRPRLLLLPRSRSRTLRERSQLPGKRVLRLHHPASKHA
jgi:hypothetical protein